MGMGKIRRYLINIFTWAPEAYSALKFALKKGLEYGEHFDFVANYAKHYAEAEAMIEELPDISQWIAFPLLVGGLLFVWWTNRRSASHSEERVSEKGAHKNDRPFDIIIGTGAPFEI